MGSVFPINSYILLWRIPSYKFVCFSLISCQNEEQIIHEFVLDGTVTHVGSKVIRRVCLHSNATSCNPYACICLKGQFECICWNIVHINNAFPSQYVCENLEHNVLSCYITSRKRPHLRSSALYMASSVRTSLLKPVVLRLYIFFVFPPISSCLSSQPKVLWHSAFIIRTYRVHAWEIHLKFIWVTFKQEVGHSPWIQNNACLQITSKWLHFWWNPFVEKLYMDVLFFDFKVNFVVHWCKCWETIFYLIWLLGSGLSPVSWWDDHEPDKSVWSCTSRRRV